MFPDADYPPSFSAQSAKVALVTLECRGNLFPPFLGEFVFTKWEPPSMAEIAIDKDNQFHVAKDDFRPSGQFRYVLSKERLRPVRAVTTVRSGLVYWPLIRAIT